jgi:Tfp pilus assembly protein PilO
LEVKLAFRRQKQQYLFAAGLAAIALVNLLFFVLLYRPARNEYYGLQESIERLHRDIQVRTHNAERLEKLSSQLETSEEDRKKMYTTRFLQRDSGFSEILPDLEAIAQRIGVQKSRVDYSIASEPQYGLYSVRIRLPVEGSYPNIVRFIRELEKSDIFFIIEAVSVRAASNDASAVSGGNVALSMGLETFFYQ